MHDVINGGLDHSVWHADVARNVHSQELAAHKRACREHGNLAAARSILRGASQDGTKCSGAAAAPKLPPFRATATLQELAVLMQQAAAETPHYE
jgi:hypothetical protein